MLSLRRTLPLALIAISLARCGTAPSSSPFVYNACNGIILPPRLNDADRAQLSREIDTASLQAEWPKVLDSSGHVEDQVRKCQTVK